MNRSLTELNQLHRLRRSTDPEHDLVDCACCCMDCDDLSDEVKKAMEENNLGSEYAEPV